MVQLTQPGSEDPLNYDLSFIYTKRCDLTCAFCMYRSGPDVVDGIDLAKLESWLGTVDMDRISSFGAYGGEVSVDLAGFSACFDLVSHVDRPHFVITNGTWSTSAEKTAEFLDFCSKYRCHVVVSGTPRHRRHQNRAVLEVIAEEQPGAVRLKPKEENFRAMGRLEGRMKFSCSKECTWWDKALRIAVQPDGTIVYQNCDGIYPVVGTIDEPFAEVDARIQRQRKSGFAESCPHWPG